MIDEKLNPAEAIALLVEMTCQNAAKTLGIGPGDVMLAMTMQGIDTCVKTLPHSHRRLIMTRIDFARALMKMPGAKSLREATEAHHKATNAAYDEGTLPNHARH